MRLLGEIDFNIDIYNEKDDFFDTLLNGFIIHIINHDAIEWRADFREDDQIFISLVGTDLVFGVEASYDEINYLRLTRSFETIVTNIESRLSKNVIDISIDIDLFAVRELNQARRNVKVHDYSALAGDYFERFRAYRIADNILTDLQSELISMVKTGDSSWIPYLPHSPEYYSCVVYVLFNVSILNAVVFVNNRDLRHLQNVNRYQEVEMYNEQQDDNYFSGDDRQGFRVPPAKNIELISSCLGLYMDVKTSDTLKYLAKEYDGDTFSSRGSYIFLCPTNIEKFVAEIWNDFWISSNTLYANDKKSMLYKLVFLHEVGHMAFKSLSLKKKNSNEETLANWVASFCITGRERELIREKTQKQPREYQRYITRPDADNDIRLRMGFDKYFDEMARLIDYKR